MEIVKEHIANKVSSPKLRFKEFEGNWEERKLGDICVVKTGAKDTQDQIDDGMYPFYVRSNTVERINTFSFEGEAILTSGDGVGVGKNFHYINGKFDYHQRVYALHSFKTNYCGKYVYLVFSEKFYRRVMRLSAKNSVDSVRRSMITEMDIYFPTLPEQEKIASFLSAVDERIQKLERKKSLLEDYKKGVMRQLFSQELRFKDENGNNYPDWEEKKLGDIAINYHQGINTAADRLIYEKSGYPILQAKHITDEVINFSDARFLSKLDYSKYANKYKPILNDILISNIGTLGKVVHVEEDLEYLIAWNIFKVTLNQELTDSKFILYVLRGVSDNGYFERVKTGNATKFVNKADMLSIKVPLPLLKEQQKIASFLSEIDKKIELVETQIQQSKTFKKGLLQQMFV